MLLAQAMQLIQQEPNLCCGMAAGWILVDEAKSLMLLVTSSFYDRVRVRGLLGRVVTAYRSAIEHFGKDESQDGPYGYHLTAVKLVSVLMACDDMLILVERDELYREENLHAAQQLLDNVHSSQVVQSLIKTDHSLTQYTYIFILMDRYISTC